MRVTEEALYRGIDAARVGNHLVEIGKAIQPFVEAEGFSVVRQFIGHGIGEEMHEDPQVCHFITALRGPRLRAGMVMTVEPMINIGSWEVKTDDNGWTARTVDGKKSCQFEHTFVIREEGPEILTLQDDTSLSEAEIAWIDAYRF